MMSFLLIFIFTLPLMILSLTYFWLVAGLVVFFLIYFMMKNFIFFDHIYFSGYFYVDVLSLSLIILSIWVTSLMLFSSFGVYKSYSSVLIFSLLVLILCVTLIITFSSSNLLMFYFFFEASLIPTLMIIMGWGYQPERIQAGVYFLFYTLTASLPLLLVLIYVYNSCGELEMLTMTMKNLNYNSGVLFILLSMAFLVKMPMFFTHLWLPKAHVEAPVSGSMVLAGVLLKLGGYGFYRVLGLCLGGLKSYGSYFFGLSVLGMMYVGFMCCRLNDLKALVAYSSVAHMGMVISGVFSMYIWGLTGGLMMMLSHGLASSGLFCVVNMYYERSGSRSIYVNKGLILVLPLMSLLIFMLSISNMAAPPTVNLMSEVFLMASILKFDKIMLFAFPLGSYMGAVFTLYFFSFSQHGKSYFSSYSYEIPTFRELHTLVLHLIPINFLILKAEFFMNLYY